MSEPLRDTITEDLADGNGDLAAPCSVQDVADMFDLIDRLTAERDAARAGAARLREALEACAANIEETGEWGMDALAKTRVALAPPTDQGEGA